MNRTNARRIAFFIAAAAAAFGGFLTWRGNERQALIVEAVPARPELTRRPAGLVNAIADAERRAAQGRNAEAALEELSRLYHANGFLEQALECYRALEQLQPDNPYWPYRYSMIVAGYGQTEPAVERLRRVIEKDSEYHTARIRLAEILLKQGDTAGAAGLFEEVLTKVDNHPHALLGLARCAMERFDWATARSYLERVVQETDYRLGYDLIVTVYERLGMGDKAAEVRGRAKFLGTYRDVSDPWMEELMHDCFDTFQLSLAAGASKDRGDNQAARNLLERAVQISPEDHMLRFQLGMILSALGETNAARQQLEKCTALQPTFADGWAHLSGLLLNSGDQAASQRVFAQGLAHCPDSPGLHFMRARQLVQQGRLEQAVPHFEKSIQLRPTEADPHVELAVTLFKLRRVEEGMARMEAALVAEPEHPGVLTTMAFGAISGKDIHAARAWLRRAEAQPRVPRQELQALDSLYERTFGERRSSGVKLQLQR